MSAALSYPVPALKSNTRPRAQILILEPDLAVLDLNLPKVGGASVLEAMRQSKDLERVPVFIMTSSAAPREQARARELGVERFITKPLDLEEFLKIGHVVKEVLLKSTAGPEVAGSSSHTTAE